MKRTSTIYSIIILGLLGVVLFSACKKQAVLTPDGQNATDNSGGGGNVEPDSSWTDQMLWFPFNANTAEYSGTGNTTASLYDISSASDRFNTPDGAFAFNGVSSYIKATNFADACLANTDFTINVFVKPTSYGGPNGSIILGKRGIGPGNGWVLSINNTSNSTVSKPGLVSFIPGSTDKYAIDSTAISLNQWVMITITYNHITQQCGIYLDGVLNTITNGIVSPAANTASDIYIGRDNPENTSESYFYKGTIDELRIYNRVLSVSELRKLKSRTF